MQVYLGSLGEHKGVSKFSVHFNHFELEFEDGRELKIPFDHKHQPYIEVTKESRY